MVAVRRRILGVTLFAVGVLVLVQPLALSIVPDALPSVSDPATLVVLVPPAAFAAGSILFVSGLASIRGRPLSPRGSFAVPIVGLAAAFGVALAVDLDLGTLQSLAVPEPYRFVLAGVLVGGAIAPVTLGALKGDTPALTVGTALLLAGVFLSPAPGFVLAVGLASGCFPVVLLWGLDEETWRP